MLQVCYICAMERDRSKKTLKTNPVGIRFDITKLDFVKEMEKLETNQQVVTYLLDKYWWEHKIVPPNQNVPTNNSYNPITDVPKPPKPKIVRGYDYFTKQLSSGFEFSEDHKIFIEQVNESDLSQRQKESLITASRTIQS